MTTLVLSTRNQHKIGEIRAILQESFRYLTLDDFPTARHIVEDAQSFAGNATKKAVQLAEWLAPMPGESMISKTAQASAEGVFVLADDSGLEVDALGGAPGVHSARFAALDSRASSNSPDAENNAKLLRLLEDVPWPDRTARFRCVIALTPILAPRSQNASPVCLANEFELQTRIFEGKCEGRIALSASGQNGFGYDPLFVPDGFERSFAELSNSTKNQISHRARALLKLGDYLRQIDGA